MSIGRAPRPACLHCVDDYSTATQRGAAFGDLIALPDQAWEIWVTPTRGISADTRLLEDSLATVLFLRTDVTDRFSDALTHYAGCARDVRARGVHLVVIVRPSDVGFRNAFSLPEHERLLAARWTAVAVAACGADWWLYDAAFSTHWPRGFDQYILTGPRVVRAALEFFTQSTAEPVAGRQPEVHVTRDFTRLVVAYRDWLQTPKTAYLVFRSTHNWAEHMPDIVGAIENRLERRRWHCAEVLFDIRDTKGFGERDTYAVRVVGPVKMFDRTVFAAALADLGSIADTRLETIVDSDSARQRSRLRRYRDYAWLEKRSDHWTSACVGGREWSAPPEHQWPSVHRFLLDRALALAPLALPTYVLLWLLEWLPEMRHHEHIQAVRLLEAVRASVQRVCAARRGK